MSSTNREFEKIQSMSKKLNQISPSFCLVRWRHASINLSTGASKSCCHHGFKSVDLRDSGNELHDNAEEQALRKKMLQGQRPSDCSCCWWLEDKGQVSDRLSWSAKSWMAPSFPERPEKLTKAALSPSWVELNFSSKCNLKCVYCSPIFSTKWYQEIKEYGPYPTSVPHNSIDHLNHLEFQDKYENGPLLEKFWPWFDNILPNIKLLKVTGGEPLLSAQLFLLIDKLLETNCPELTFGINSNCSVSEEIWGQFVSKVTNLESRKNLKQIYLHPSLDCFGARAEYIRSGLSMDLFIKNIETFLERTTASVHFICTLNNLALGGLEDFWRFVLDLKKKYQKSGRDIAIGTEILKYPAWLNINILPDELVVYLDQAIDFAKKNQSEQGDGFRQTEILGLERARVILKSKTKNTLSSARQDFVRYIEAIDHRRHQNFYQTFPELVSFYETWRK